MSFMDEMDHRPNFTYANCTECNGSKINRGKRNSRCPKCNGSGKDTPLRCGVCYKLIKEEYGLCHKVHEEPTCKCVIDDDGILKKRGK